MFSLSNYILNEREEIVIEPTSQVKIIHNIILCDIYIVVIYL